LDGYFAGSEIAVVSSGVGRLTALRAVPPCYLLGCLHFKEEAVMSLPATMRATVLVEPHRFELLERPLPTVGAEDVLVRVRACGI
jgi:hypothetical protein